MLPISYSLTTSALSGCVIRSTPDLKQTMYVHSHYSGINTDGVQGTISDCNAALALDSGWVLALVARAGAKRMLRDFEASC